jgi:hypothetical protein
MADAKISALTEDTAPHRTNDFVPTYDASAVATKKVSLKNLGAYELLAMIQNLNPTDATTYYFGAPGISFAFNTAAAHAIGINRTGIITRVNITIAAVTAYGSAETSTISIRKNNTTDTTITSTFAVTTTTILTVTGLNCAVTAGDYVEIKWVTPTWATNPVGLYLNVQMFVE